MKKFFNILVGESYKNNPLRSKYYLLEAAENLLDEAVSHPASDYDEYKYLLMLHRLERLLDDLRPGQNEGLKARHVYNYRNRETKFREGLSKFQSGLDQEAVKRVIGAQTESDGREGEMLMDVRQALRRRA